MLLSVSQISLNFCPGPRGPADSPGRSGPRTTVSSNYYYGGTGSVASDNDDVSAVGDSQSLHSAGERSTKKKKNKRKRKESMADFDDYD